MSDRSGVTSTASRVPARRRAPRILISSSSPSSPSSSSSSSPPPLSSSSASNPNFHIPNLLEPIVIVSSPSAHYPSARILEEAAELDAFIDQQATSVPSPKSPHDSPGKAQGGASEDRDSSEGTPAPEQGMILNLTTVNLTGKRSPSHPRGSPSWSGLYPFHRPSSRGLPDPKTELADLPPAS
nr:putative protein TPRXL [Coffea arabica]